MLKTKIHGRVQTLGLAGLLALLLAGCGGGGNESGPSDNVVVEPSAITVGSQGHCVAGLGPKVHVFGGTPPYKLSNSVPQGMWLDTDRLQNSGDAVTITFTGVCLINMPVVVEDTMGHLAQVLVTNGG